MTDYQEAIQNPQICFEDMELKNGRPSLNNLGLPKPISGRFATVYQINYNSKKYAVRCFLSYYPDQQRRYQILSLYLDKLNLPYMVDFKFLERGIKVKGKWYPILKMEWIEGEPLDLFLKKNLLFNSKLEDLASKFVSLINDLKQHNIAHGDLQHGNILIINGQIKLIDYDGMYVPGLNGLQSHEVGHRNYQHPSRTAKDFGAYIDNFSEWVIYVSILALILDKGLGQRFDPGDEKIILAKEDFDSPNSSLVFRKLEALQDVRIKSLVPVLKSFNKIKDISQIPALYGPGIGSLIDNKKLPDWIEKHQNTNSNRSDNADSKVPWFDEYVSQLAPVNFTYQNVLVERLILGALFISIWGHLTSLYLDLFHFRTAFLSFGFHSTLSMGVLFSRFSNNSELAKLKKLKSRLKFVKRNAAKIENSLNILVNKSLIALMEEEKQVDSLLDKEKALNNKKNMEISQVHSDTNSKLIKIRQKISQLDQAEKNEINNQLAAFKNKILTNELINVHIYPANIAGIGPHLKARLFDLGIKTAADIVKIHTETVYGYRPHEKAYIEKPGGAKVYIPGIGPTKANALYEWKEDLESSLKAKIPLNLPAHLLKEIKSKYDSIRDFLNDQEKELLIEKEQLISNCNQELTALTIRKSKILNDYKFLELDIENLKNELSEKISSCLSLERDILRYKKINFIAYIKGSFPYSKAKQTRNIST